MLREYWHRPRSTRLRAWLFQIHLWLGLVLGSVIAIVGLTGSIVVFRYEINRLTTPGTAYVEPQGERLPLDRLIDAVKAARPGEDVRNVSFEADPDVAWNLRTQTKDGRRVHNYVDQYRAIVTSQDDYSTRWTQWLFDLHAYLLGGKTGEFLNGFVAVATMIMATSGLVVWWPGRRNWRFGLKYLITGNWRRQNYDLHKLVGFYGSILLLVVSFTGAYFAFPNLYKKTAGALLSPNVTDPDKCADQGPKATTTMAARRVPYEQYIVSAERAAPGMRAVFIAFPEQRDAAVGVKMKGSKDWHRVGLSDVYLEPATADVIRVDRFDTLPAGSQFVRLMLPLHFGRFGGRLGLGRVGYYAIMVLYVVIGVALPVLMLTGYLMYWNRSLSKKVRHRRVALGAAV
jgi:uncharacterized iron-regulated membrane protein